MSPKNLKHLASASKIISILLVGLLLVQTHTKTSTEKEALVVVDTPRQKTAQAPTNASILPATPDAFHHSIIDNNLFCLLGWRPPRPREPYHLIGTIIPTDGKTRAQAILQATTGNTTHTVSLRKTLEDFILIDIQPKQVTLEKDGKQRTLKLNSVS